MELLISVDGTIITLVRMLTFLKTTPLHEYCAELYGMLIFDPKCDVLLSAFEQLGHCRSLSGTVILGSALPCVSFLCAHQAETDFKKDLKCQTSDPHRQ